ncbi:protein ALEX-like [Anser cygnoides]|uniref:protein ALEX-like n=1 Tax=Anser cygnoides TaxID=8845 RepID=UPI0034D1BA97
MSLPWAGLTPSADSGERKEKGRKGRGGPPLPPGTSSAHGTLRGPAGERLLPQDLRTNPAAAAAAPVSPSSQPPTLPSMSLPLGENGVRSPLPPPARGSPAPPGRGRVTKAKPNSRHFACGLLRARRPPSPQCPFYKQPHGWARPRERSEGSLELRPRLLLPPPPSTSASASSSRPACRSAVPILGGSQPEGALWPGLLARVLPVVARNGGRRLEIQMEGPIFVSVRMGALSRAGGTGSSRSISGHLLQEGLAGPSVFTSCRYAWEDSPQGRRQGGCGFVFPVAQLHISSAVQLQTPTRRPELPRSPAPASTQWW